MICCSLLSMRKKADTLMAVETLLPECRRIERSKVTLDLQEIEDLLGSQGCLLGFYVVIKTSSVTSGTTGLI